MLSRRVVVVGFFSAAALLISVINVYLRETTDKHLLEYASDLQIFANFLPSREPQVQTTITMDVKSQDNSLPFNNTKGYLLALYVLEQLTMSSAHYISLLNLAQSWGLTGLEPTICRSRMYGLPGIASLCNQHPNASQRKPQNSVEVRYSRLYNLSYLNRKLKQCFSADLRCRSGCVPTDTSLYKVIESLDYFIQSSYRELVLVHFVRGVGGSASRVPFLPPDVVRSLEHKVTFSVENPIVDCTRLARETGLTSVVEHLFNQLASKTSDFEIKRVICIDTDRSKDGIDARHLKNAIFHSSLPNVSVVFTKWQNRGVIGEGRSVLSRCKVSPIHHSEEVIATSKRFLSSMNIRQPFLSVHLRLERLYQCEALIPGYTSCCVERLSSLLSKVLRKHGIDKKDVLIIKDYGQYGTESCTYKREYVAHSICLNLTRDFFANLREYGYSASEFLPVKFDGVPDNSAFVSLVEAGAILSGSALVAGGFGSYQGTVIKQFLGIDDPSISFKHFDDSHRYGNSSLYDSLYKVCTCTPLKGHLEKLNGLNLGIHSCEDLNSG